MDRDRWFEVFYPEDSGVSCYLRDVARLLRLAPPTTIKDVLPERGVVYYMAAMSHWRHLFTKDMQMPGLRTNSFTHNSNYESNAEEKAQGLSIQQTKPLERQDYLKLMGWPLDSQLPDSKKGFMGALGQSVCPMVAALVYSCIQIAEWKGPRQDALRKTVRRLQVQMMSEDDGLRIYIPRGDECRSNQGRKLSEEAVASIVATAHQGVSGHQGGEATERTIRKVFYFSDMHETVKNLVKQCLQCQKNTAGELVPRPFGNALLGTKPNEVLHMDYFWIGDGTFCLTIKDSFSKYCRLRRCADCTAASAASKLCEWFGDFGPCEWLVSDSGSHFKNRVVKTLTEMLGIQHHINTPHIHHAAGTVEVLQRRVKALLRKLVSELNVPFEEAGNLLPAVQMACNHEPNPKGLAPVTLMCGTVPDTPLRVAAKFGGPSFKTVKTKEVGSLLQGALRDHLTRVKEAVASMHEELLEETVAQRHKSRKSSNKHKAGGRDPYMPYVEPGDLILVSTPEVRSTKLEFNWKGPWQVRGPAESDVWVRQAHGVDDDDEYEPPAQIYECTHVYDAELWGHPEITKKVHVTNMIPWAAKLDGKSSEEIQQLQELAYTEYQNAFLVEDVVGHDTTGDELRLRVHWQGIDEEASTLEPLDNLTQAYGKVLSYLGAHKDEHPLLLDAFDEVRERRRRRRKLRSAAVETDGAAGSAATV